MIFVCVSDPSLYVLTEPTVYPSLDSLSFHLPANPEIDVEFWISIEIFLDDDELSVVFFASVVLELNAELSVYFY